ncbi:molybdenum cofactor guanylyltransferase, partial [Sandarakinorhabdus rubra]|uniref:molybdenum cofactor guanylyltransferase n=1 Tax=Sandarakinorhabdus rubra TaxID=2672568 RepID=UPI0013DC86EE
GITVPHIADPAPGLGPIGALAAGFGFAAGAGCDRLLLIGCDQPFLPADLLPRLAAAIAGAGAALPARGGQVEPLAGLWQVDEPALAAYIAGGGRSLHGFAQAQGHVTADWPAEGADPFANINTPADLAAANRRLTPGL